MIVEGHEYNMHLKINIYPKIKFLANETEKVIKYNSRNFPKFLISSHESCAEKKLVKIFYGIFSHTKGKIKNIQIVLGTWETRNR